ncbi:unnamed protein product [Dovyalis caffra]|uniref:GDSL esterase/lipase 1-like n=1 Tax=Dovyalis caffra TaxID=77055 RepID=A0AAV1RSX6_9ROSI|nr:unnamed protein product [Dovyalis caffra]
MATSSSNINLCFLMLCVSLLITTTCHGYSDHAALFIFGDSLYDAGNNNYFNNTIIRANFTPYGETFFKYPTGRASDGRLIPDFIAEYANLPLIPPYLQPGNNRFIDGANFASIGAGALVETNGGLVIDLQTQLSYFMNMEKQLKQQLGDTEAKKVLSKAVYIFSIGGNDYFAALAPNSTILQLHSRKEYVGMVIGNITTVIKGIHKRGGRKFGFSKMINLGCLPSLRAVKMANTGRSGCMDEATLLTKLHNRALSKTLKELERQLEGFKYSNFDA